MPKVGPGVGLGHVTRCGALAIPLREMGLDVRFLLPKGSPERARAKAWGLEASVLPGAPLPSEAAYVVDCGADRRSWPVAFEGRPRALVVLDDKGLDVGRVDLVVNPNAHAQRDWYSGTTALLGPRFSLLRPPFERARRRRRAIRARGTRVLVSLGGADPLGATETVLAALSSVPANLHVVEGPDFPRPLKAPGGTRARVRILHAPSDLAEDLMAADLAVVGGGSTLYEAAACGTPAIALSMNEDQEAHARCLDRLGAVEYFGPAASAEPDALREDATRLLSSPDRRRDLSRGGRRLVDGRGTERVARSISRVLGLQPPRVHER